jgi:hypothetical protein
METEKELNKKILKITMLIQEQYPELTRFLEEMTETIPSPIFGEGQGEVPEININNLKEYYNSLNSLVENYVHEHSIKV